MSLSRAIERLDAIVSHHLEADQVDSVLDGIAVLLRQGELVTGYAQDRGFSVRGEHYYFACFSCYNTG